MIRTLAILFGLSVLTPVSPGADWRQFRGPQGSGVSTETHLPGYLDAAKNSAWKIASPGLGW